MDKRLMKASDRSDRLWYAFRTDTDYAQLIAPEYLGTAGWHPATESGKAAAVTRARLKYFWVPQDDLDVSTDRPDCLPEDDPEKILEGWVNPLSVHAVIRQEVSENNFRIANEYRAAIAKRKNRNTDSTED